MTFPGAASENIDIPEEEVQQIKDYGKAFADTVTETKDELEDIQKKYTWVKDNLGNYKHPKILKLINTLDKNGLGTHLKNSISTFARYDKGLKKIADAKAVYDEAVAFSDKYKPDKNNPLRSLEQISNSLEELNNLIKKIDPSEGILTKPITAIIDYYQQSAGAFHGALDRLRKMIKERGGGGIGIGFPVDTNKDRLFKKKFPNETAYRYPWIKYIKPGSDEEEAEFWDNRSDRSFVWRNDDWTEIKSGIAGLRMAYDGMSLAFGKRPGLNTLISRCNTDWDEVMKAQKNGKHDYNLLFSNSSCITKLLAYKKIRLEKFPEKKFIARYIFRKDTRKKIDHAIKLVQHSLIVEGKVTEGSNPDKGLANIIITAESSGSRAQSKSEPGGWFTLLFNLSPSAINGNNAHVTINAQGYKPYSKDWPLRQQCNSWYNLELFSEEGLVRVPGLIGLTTPGAREQLEALGLVPVKGDGGMPPSAEQSDRIIWQSPEKDTMVAKGSKVSFQAYWLVANEETPPAKDEGTTPEIKTDLESTTNPEAVDANTDRSSDGLEGYVGGLSIAGKTEIISGEGVSYTACDGAGKPYPASGSYSWNSSVEDVLVLGHSGQPVSGSGFKAGTSTIILHYDGMTKFLDIKVKAKVPDVTGMSTKQAAGTIEGLNLRTSISGNSKDLDSLAVVSQTPAPGTIVDADTVIVLEPGKEKANLFSMSGGEKVEEKKPIFSMASGEKVDRKTAYLEQEKKPAPPVKSTHSVKTQNNKLEQKFILTSNYTYCTSSTYLRLWNVYGSWWHFDVKLQNVSYKDIKGKYTYLLVKINNRRYFVYFSPVRCGFRRFKYNDNDLVEIHGRIPTEYIGTKTVEISYPAFPNIPALKVQIASDPIYKPYLILWGKNTNESAYANLSQLKQGYEQALTIAPDDLDYYYNVSQAAILYAEALVRMAESYCGLGKFKEAMELNTQAIPVLIKNISVHDVSEHKNGFDSSYDYLIAAYRRQAHICLMGLHDRKGYVENSTTALDLLHKKYERFKGHTSKGMWALNVERISDWAMGVSEELLTSGFNKSYVKQYFDIGLKYMEKDKLKVFKDFENSCADQGYRNCREIFIHRSQQ